jgi:hypothetical protein
MKFMDLWIYDTRWNDTQCYDTQYKYIYDSNVQHKGSELNKENAKLSITSLMMGAIVLSLVYSECHYAECHYAQCHYAKCHHAQCLDMQ